MLLASLQGLSIAFGNEKLLDDAKLTIQSGDRIGLLGRNGAGKSTLLALMAQKLLPDEGDIHLTPDITVALLEQVPKLPDEATIFDVVASGLGQVGAFLTEFYRITAAGDGLSTGKWQSLESLQQSIEACDGWRLEQRVKKILSRLSLTADTSVTTLSVGWQRRVCLARSLVSNPDILLLDEPTNHLDIASIEWLEDQLMRFQGAILFVTHDRTFLRRVANRILDLDRGQLRFWAGGYEDYLRRQNALLEQESRQQAKFDRKLAQEEAWIRQGIQARRTRNEDRVRALVKMRAERRRRQARDGQVRFNLEHAERGGRLVLETQDISFAYGDMVIARDFSTRILRGDRIGLIGDNGIGKTTLIRLLLGEQVPDSGHIRLGHNLQVAWFDQLRAQIDINATVVEAIGDGREKITIRGKDQHVISYLSNFLFSPARSRSPVSSLSGGEMARVLLAKLFSRPANLLIMDEPTNDLDIETLELLEELLLDFPGTLILASHDRQFMDNVVTSTLSFEGQGIIREWVGGYRDWERQQSKNPRSDAPDVTPPSGTDDTIRTQKAFQRPPTKKKPGFREQQELAALLDRIKALEERQSELSATVSDRKFYHLDQQTVTATLRELHHIPGELEQCYRRWEQLES